MKSKAGSFFSEADGRPLRLVADGARLRVAGGPALVTLAANRFRNPDASLQLMSGDQFELRFISNHQIELKSMEGKTTRFRRTQSYTPSGDDLKAFAGRYGNDENKVVFGITPSKAGLTVRVSWNGSQAFEFVPVDRDTFQYRGMIVRFRRDKAGAIVGFDYSNPVLRNITFTRVKGEEAALDRGGTGIRGAGEEVSKQVKQRSRCMLRASAASEPRDRSEPAQRRARARVGEAEGRSPSE